MVLVTFRIFSPYRRIIVRDVLITALDYPTSWHVRHYIEREVFGGVRQFTQQANMIQTVNIQYLNNRINDFREESHDVDEHNEIMRIHYRTELLWGFPGQPINQMFSEVTYMNDITPAEHVNIDARMDPDLAAEIDVLAPGPLPDPQPA